MSHIPNVAILGKDLKSVLPLNWFYHKFKNENALQIWLYFACVAGMPHYAYTCRGQRRAWASCSITAHHFSRDRVSHWTWSSPLLSRLGPVILPSRPPDSSRVPGCIAVLSFYMGPGDLNSNPPACSTSVLTPSHFPVPTFTFSPQPGSHIPQNNTESPECLLQIPPVVIITTSFKQNNTQNPESRAVLIF